MRKQVEPKNFDTVSKLCCCIKLETGMTVLALLKLILCVLIVIFSILVMFGAVPGFEGSLYSDKFTSKYSK